MVSNTITPQFAARVKAEATVRTKKYKYVWHEEQREGFKLWSIARLPLELEGTERAANAWERVAWGAEPIISKRISVDNGASWASPAEAIAARDWDLIASVMDDDTRERVHRELAPCSDEDFLIRYLELAPDHLIIG